MEAERKAAKSREEKREVKSREGEKERERERNNNMRLKFCCRHLSHGFESDHFVIIHKYDCFKLLKLEFFVSGKN